MEYIIATGVNPQELDVKVNEFTEQGFAPVGGIVFSPARLDPRNQDKFLQIMVRKSANGEPAEDIKLL